ncbi:MAG: transcriptional repressor [Melioribacteraceae bacterium]|nr:transcriptional repressor [Melioribacteraceae bacterium]
MERKEAHEKFRKFLKEGENRITPERFEVLDYAINFDGHFGADELFLKMKKSKSNISRATVYNTLELLAQCGLFSKRNFGENKTRYESNIGKVSHDHLICTNCGAIKEFEEPRIQKIVEEISKDLGFLPNGYSFNIFGKCININCKRNKNG